MEVTSFTPTDINRMVRLRETLLTLAAEDPESSSGEVTRAMAAGLKPFATHGERVTNRRLTFRNRRPN